MSKSTTYVDGLPPIKVIGVGGGGSNAVSRMAQEKISGVELVAALTEKRIGGAFLDVTTPEPLPSDHPLWRLDNAHVTMHLSGRAQSKMFVRSAERFVANCRRFVAGEPLEPVFDTARGY